jgi:Tol biopolymer transport system component
MEPRLSPDGRRLALTITATRNTDVWVYDIARGALSRLTFEGTNAAPLWTPDGKRITYQSERVGAWGLFWTAANGSGPEERLTTSPSFQLPESWSPDGRLLAFRQIDPSTGEDIWILPLEGERKPTPFLRTTFDEREAAFSPDGRWIAYVSLESGRPEVYVQAFPGPGGKWQISTDGGNRPLWARDGRELFYLRGDALMSVAITTRPAFTASVPRSLFQRGAAGGFVETNYDVTPDGQRFVMAQGSEQEHAPTQLTLVLGWLGELDRRVPKGKK